ncbi:MAG: hypothetical protein JST75_16590 [Bacteroidetes bacterium]|nr:hypothetical protein [Bacteroidota bacterium]
MLRKSIILSLLVLLHIIGFSSDKTFKDSTTVVIQLDNASHHNLNIDSVYMIFDRYDHSGAGVVMQIFYPVDNTIKVTVPKGKYYVNIVCIGTYKNEYFDKIITAKSDKEKKLLLNLQEPDLYTPGLAYIPEEKIDFSDLSITRNRSSRH